MFTIGDDQDDDEDDVDIPELDEFSPSIKR